MTDTQKALEAAKAQALWAIKKWQRSMTAEELTDAIFDSPAFAALQSRTEQEPVAWRWRPKGTDRWIYYPNFEWLNSQLDSDIDKEPIYTSPPDQSARIAELEKALRLVRAKAIPAGGAVVRNSPNWKEMITDVLDIIDAALHNKLKEK